METMDPFWFSLQNLLTAAANISKALWGPGGQMDGKATTI
jgi:hypothetical protein